MICYKDMTFCSAECKNTDCHRQFTEEIQVAADKWWGDIGGEAPVAFADFGPGCGERIAPK